jgi:hypothetical protein
MRLFGEQVFKNIIVIVNKWPLAPTSFDRSVLEQTTKPLKPEDKFRSEIKNVFTGLAHTTTFETVEFTNNYHSPLELYYWELFEDKLSSLITSLRPLNVSKRILQRIELYKNDTAKLFDFEKAYSEDIQLVQVTRRIAHAETALDQLYTTWKGYVSFRLLIINESMLQLTAISISRKDGYFESSPTQTEAKETLDLTSLLLQPYTAAWVFHRKHQLGFCGVRGKLKYASDDNAELKIKWEVTYSEDSGNPKVSITGNLRCNYMIIENIKNKGTNEPMLVVKIREKSEGTTLCCENNHKLEWDPSLGPPSRACDICECSLAGEKGWWRCRRCDYDLCHQHGAPPN